MGDVRGEGRPYWPKFLRRCPRNPFQKRRGYSKNAKPLKLFENASNICLPPAGTVVSGYAKPTIHAVTGKIFFLLRYYSKNGFLLRVGGVYKLERNCKANSRGNVSALSSLSTSEYNWGLAKGTKSSSSVVELSNRCEETINHDILPCLQIEDEEPDGAQARELMDTALLPVTHFTAQTTEIIVLKQFVYACFCQALFQQMMNGGVLGECKDDDEVLISTDDSDELWSPFFDIADEAALENVLNISSPREESPLGAMYYSSLYSDNALQNKSPFCRKEDGHQTLYDIQQEENTNLNSHKSSSASHTCQSEYSSNSLMLLDSRDFSVPSCLKSGDLSKICEDDITFLKSLGQGSGGIVYLGLYSRSQVAVKFPNNSNDRIAIERIRKEMKILEKLNHHPKIVRYLGELVKDNHPNASTCGIVMEYCPYGNLMEAIRKAKWLEERDNTKLDLAKEKYPLSYRIYTSWQLRLDIVLDATSALSFMHKYGIVHRDFTSQNIFLYQEPNGVVGAKIGDFERANYIPSEKNLERINPMANSPPWSAPEILRCHDYNVQADIFSLGVILWELIYLNNPWETLNSLCGQQINSIISELKNGRKLPLPHHDAMNDHPQLSFLTKLIEDSWKDNPNERPTVVEFQTRLTSIKDSIATNQ